MNTQTLSRRWIPTFLTLLLALGTLLQGAAPALADDDLGPLPPTITIAHPRAGFVSWTEAGAENFLTGRGQTSDNPLTTISAGRPFWLHSAYEAVFYPRSSGWASYDLYVYLMHEDGQPTLLGEDHAREAGLGPLLKSGSLHVDLQFDEPGLYQLLIRSRTMARALANPTPAVDEDEITVFVVVTPPGADQASDRDQPTPVPLDSFTVGRPRTAVVTPAQVGVDNFAQGHGAQITVRAGSTVTFTTGYEFVWYEGAVATTTATSSLQLFRPTEVATPTSVADDKVEVQAKGPHRAAGRLQVPVTFPDPGTFTLLARLETQVIPPGAVSIAGHKDVDEVRLLVRVVGQPEEGAIAGRVTALDTGLPLEGVRMWAYRAETGWPAGRARTDDDGRYLIRGLKPGAYLVRAEPRHQNYLPEWYDDVFEREDATPVEVNAGQTTINIDFVLSPGGKLSGQVTLEEDDAPLAGARIQVGDFMTGKVIARGRTLEDGTYLIERLPSGVYWVYADAPYRSVIGEFYDDKLTMDEADPVFINAGQETTGIDFALAQGGSISGWVAGEVGPMLPAIKRLMGIKVDGLRWDDNRPIGRAETGPDGNYRIRSLPAGTYRVYAYDPLGRYQPEFYDDATDPEAATPVEVTAGEDTPEINFILSKVLYPIVSIYPRVTQIRAYQPITVSVQVAEVRDLGSFAFDLAYDPKVVHVEDVILGGFLGGTGREVLASEPVIDNENGRVHFEATSRGDQAGPSGGGDLALVVLSGQAEGASELALESVTLATTDGELIQPITQDGRVVVGGCILGDVNCDCRVDIVDARLVASRWGAVEGDPDYDPRYDLDDDGDIDLDDLFIVLENWGRTCDETVRRSAVAALAGPASVAGKSDQSAPASGVWLEVPAGPFRQGQTVTVRLMIADALDLSGVQFHIGYDPAVLRPISAQVGSLLDHQMSIEVPLHVDDGNLAYGAVMLGAGPGVEGAGCLAQVTFQVIGAGQSELTLSEVRTTDSFGQEQDSMATQGATLEAEGGMMLYLPIVAGR